MLLISQSAFRARPHLSDGELAVRGVGCMIGAWWSASPFPAMRSRDASPSPAPQLSIINGMRSRTSILAKIMQRDSRKSSESPKMRGSRVAIGLV
jgi:hypothetical protein